VTLDGLEGKTHLHVILNVDIVEPEAYTLQQRAFPALIAGDDPVIDLLDLFRGESSTDCFYNVLVVAFTVETTVDGIIINTRSECCVVVVDNCEVLSLVILENY
jgi:hypothetical protein